MMLLCFALCVRSPSVGRIALALSFWFLGAGGSHRPLPPSEPRLGRVFGAQVSYDSTLPLVLQAMDGREGAADLLSRGAADRTREMAFSEPFEARFFIFSLR